MLSADNAKFGLFAEDWVDSAEMYTKNYNSHRSVHEYSFVQ